MNGLKVTISDFSVTESVNRMVEQIEKEEWHLFTRFDHAGEARKKGLELRPTELILFGNPEIGTLLMQDQQIAAIDLPMKMLVWENEKGQVNIAYNNLEWLKERHGLTDCTTIDQIAQIVENISRAGSKKATDNKLIDKVTSDSLQSDIKQTNQTALSSPVCYADSREVREEFRDE